MSNQRPDSERRATYEAEAAAFDGTDLESIVAFEQLASIAGRVTSEPWWSGPAITVRRARRDAATSTARCWGGTDAGRAVDVRLAADGCTLATLAHELAHALAGAERGHDGLFRRAELDLIAVVTNLDSTTRRGPAHATALRETFDRFGLDVATRRWADPASDDGPEGFGGRAIAL